MPDSENTPPNPAPPDDASVAHQLRILQPPPRGMDVNSITASFAHRMTYSVARDHYTATPLDAFQATALSVRDRLMDRWFLTQDAYYKKDVKRIYYLSLEFLLGRSCRANLLNLGAEEEFEQALREIGYDAAALEEHESDAGLGNGGLGRLAACFLDSASTLALPFYGYGIRYEYGIFRQQLDDGNQTEQPDSWLRFGNPWEVARVDVLFLVKFYGRVEYYKADDGRDRMRWVDTEDVQAMAYDMPMAGFRNDTVNSLRLWTAKSTREFDLASFNAGEYVKAVENKTQTENISKVLYPPDDRYAGRELRLKQQYFFVSATIQDVIRRFVKRPRQWSELPDKVAIQLNDTHPAVAIPELMRVLVDDYRVEWDEAWGITQKVFAYTNHTVLPEALEVWPIEIFGRLLPRHLQIIEEIDRRFRQEVSAQAPGDYEKVRRMAIIDDHARTIRMANLAIVGSHSVNGVAALHTGLLKTQTFPDLHAFFPGRFTNKTNGITPRRWLLQCNPRLAGLISEAIGDRWTTQLDELGELEKFISDDEFGRRWLAIKDANKIDFARWVKEDSGIDVDPRTVFDAQVKRIHEYKRQLLNALHVISLYHRVLDGDRTILPRTFIFAGKAAPSYRMAKLIIKLIYDIGVMIRKHPEASKLLNVVYVPNYGVTAAERIFPATELSEQISTAGLEASGTGNMKACLNGAVIIGTLDGANVELLEHLGPNNIFICGHTAEDISIMRASGYDPRRAVDENPMLKRVIDEISSGELDAPSPGLFRPIVDSLLGNDPYFVCADFAAYTAAQTHAAATWQDREQWARMSIINTARMGFFSADRTVGEYAREIWNAQPLPVKLGERIEGTDQEGTG
jgi:glycogen phosphorylase